jgi:hypothetical protein
VSRGECTPINVVLEYFRRRAGRFCRSEVRVLSEMGLNLFPGRTALIIFLLDIGGGQAVMLGNLWRAVLSMTRAIRRIAMSLLGLVYLAAVAAAQLEELVPEALELMK